MAIKKQSISSVALLGLMLGVTTMIGCTKKQKNTALGGVIGGGSGALIGGLAGGPVGAGIGAGVGIVGGAIAGNALTHDDSK